MLLHPTLDLLNTLGLSGMAKGLQDLESHPEARSLDHAEWLGLLLDQEVTLRWQKAARPALPLSSAQARVERSCERCP
ncbi:hypothetical protein EWE75_23875 [Sphingomonas populi]|uniref:Uncharacterized protein n=1 Tax=Sphingomonas populi TaxID=2484750 RepID=A0A4V2DBS9_9SPHN|nr:IstB-like ATP-binding domain-containing protein [Sphingomonas populi]RZF59048.1 hypothetical protein EWE75_23875 [Sphingomonas populi]